MGVLKTPVSRRGVGTAITCGCAQTPVSCRDVGTAITCGCAQTPVSCRGVGTAVTCGCAQSVSCQLAHTPTLFLLGLLRQCSFAFLTGGLRHLFLYMGALKRP